MNAGNKSNQNAPNPKIQSFLETLRKQRAADTESPPQSQIEELQKERHLEKKRKQEFFESRRKEFNEVYSQEKQKEQARIKEIQQQLKELSHSVKSLDQEVEKAVEMPVQEAGSYQKNFLDHLRQIIDLAKRSVEQANTWLHVFNQRQRKKGYYWSQVKKQGTKYMLSGERQVATSVG